MRLATILILAALQTAPLFADDKSKADDQSTPPKLPLAAERSVLASLEAIGKARESYLEAARKEQEKLVGVLEDEAKKETQKGSTQQALALRTFSRKLKIVTLRRLAEMERDKRPAVCGEPTMAAAIEAVLKVRETYFATIKNEQKKLVAILERELNDTQDRGTLERALALKSSIEILRGDTFRDLVEAELRKRPSAAETKEMLLGTWEVELPQKNFKTEWTFLDSGVVLSTQGAQRGTWRLEVARNRILITWGGNRAESLTLPLDFELTLGESWHGKDVRLQAKKKDPLAD